MCCWYTAATLPDPTRLLLREPDSRIDVQDLRRRHAGGKCELCNGWGRLECRQCREGREPLLGGHVACSRCQGLGWKICPVCEGLGKLPALDLPPTEWAVTAGAGRAVSLEEE